MKATRYRRMPHDVTKMKREMERLYPIGIQNFEDLRRNGYIYVDKTALIHRLVRTGKYYFLGRPRRFGKSLMISTLEAYFQGKRELFKGLDIDKLEKEWTVRPVLHIDLNGQEYKSRQDLEDMLNSYLAKWEKMYGCETSEKSASLRFSAIIRNAAKQTGQNVAILIDEYDKPLIQAIGNEKLQDEYRNTLKAFYGNLKSCDGYIKFAILTGVTRFSRVSIFSDLNNLNDITMDDNYSALCGITEKELKGNFEPDIRQLAEKMNISFDETCNRLKKLYDGYHFTENGEGMYNPFSLLNTFYRMELDNYWFATGTPTLLVKMLKQNDYRLSNLTEGVQASSYELNGMENSENNPVPMFFQTGYLTIKDYDKEFKTYTLGFPNEEVEHGFINFLMPSYVNINEHESAFQIMNFVKEVRAGKIDDFMARLQSFMAGTPYELARQQELHYQNVLYIMFSLLGFYTEAEYHTSQGRIDMVVKTKEYIYVMEFKLEGTAEEAIKQINEKQYAAPFASDPRKLYKIGVNFSRETRNIERWIVE